MAPKAKSSSKTVGKEAPAKKGAPSKTEVPAKKAEEEAPKIDPHLLVKHKILFSILGIIIAANITLTVMLFLKYRKLNARWNEINPSFMVLRRSLANAVKEPQLLVHHPKEISYEVTGLEHKKKEADKLYHEKKIQYQNLFYKTSRSSSAPWMFYGKSLYYFSKGEKTWYEAEDFCISRRAHLASILNSAEQNFISSQLQDTSWIGLKFENGESKWRWSDGSRLVKECWVEGSNARDFKISYQNCAMAVPSLAHCNWKDNNCHRLNRWVCKENLDVGEQ